MNSLLDRVVDRLEANGRQFAVIGAAAMTVHGVSRSTLDLDLFTTDSRVLLAREWDGFEGVEIDRRCGDHDDPLAGLVRFEYPGDRPIDLVIGHGGWQDEVLARASASIVGGRRLPTVQLIDLVILKLYAGGPQDLADIIQLIELSDAAVTESIELRLVSLPSWARKNWSKIETLRG